MEINAFEQFPFQLYLNKLLAQYQSFDAGELAQYIPELAKANPEHFGISLISLDGTIQKAGDTDCEFTIQSISKPFVYGLVLEDLGAEYVTRKVNSEPSADSFNAITLEPETGRPLNPMINAGAIATTSLVRGKNPKESLNRILDGLSRFAGRKLSVDWKVYESEKNTGHRNRAIAHMLRNFNIMDNNLEETLDLYFQQCSILVTCQDLAIMAGTLANDGINPITGERAISSQNVPLVLSVMSFCGMYDYSGRWLYNIGLPAKSGVGGGIIAVLPGQLGFSVYSPLLDKRGNSARGMEVCKQFSHDFSLHLLKVPKMTDSVIRTSCTVKEFHSKRLRSSQDNRLLDQEGKKAHIFELQGEIRFAGAEKAVRAIHTASSKCAFILIDFRHVPSMDQGAAAIFNALSKQMTHSSCTLAISGLSSNLGPLKLFADNKKFRDLDHALEWCENNFIKHFHTLKRKKIPFEQNELCNGLTETQLGLLKEHCQILTFRSHEKIIETGHLADRVFFLTKGDISIVLHKNEEEGSRIATLSAGMAFGEIALLGQKKRTADILADTEVECFALEVKTLNKLCETDLKLKVSLLENIAKKLVKNLQQANLEIIALNN